jgi:hypothetical protein
MWVRLQYVLGFRRLGLETFWVDHLYPHQQSRRSVDYLLHKFRTSLSDFGLADSWCVVVNQGERYAGLSESQLAAIAGGAALVVSVSGHLPEWSPLCRVPARAFVDVDPGLTQMWAQTSDMGFDRHNLFYTVGQNVGSESFLVPTPGIGWKPLCPPVVLDQWPATIDESRLAFSTVGNWIGKQGAVFAGRQYVGRKDEEFMRFLGLPQASGQQFELALWIDPEQHVALEALCRHGWRVLNPCVHAGDPFAYREFIQSSRGEFSVAKKSYVETKSGWISDRTACYLASGKPALVQSTGIEDKLPTGAGLLTFRDMAGALAGLEAINRDYQFHCHRARQLAEAYFDSERVLRQILTDAAVD